MSYFESISQHKNASRKASGVCLPKRQCTRSFQARVKETLDELALENEEEQKEGADDNHGASGHERPLGADFA